MSHEVAMSHIDAYIQNFNQVHSSFSLSKWIHEHPTAVKVAQISGVIFGAAALIGLAVATPFLATGIVVGLGIGGSLSVLGAVASWLFLRYGTCAHHDLKQHAYQEKSCEGGSLKYRGDIPVLEMTGENPEQWGYAHGYLLGPEICKLKKNLDLVLHSILRLPRSQNLPHVLAEVRKKIPQEYLTEMAGMIKGFNAWAHETKNSFRLTEDDLVLTHLIPDSKHFHPKQLERRWSALLAGEEEQAPACTSLLDRDEDGHVVFGRNMDWCPFGEGGSKSLVLVWKAKGVANLGTPGMIGVVTGWNRDRLALAINVCPGETTEARGMPAILYNRYVLESSRNVFEARRLIAESQEQPLGPYHLTMADPEEGSCVSFYQDQGQHYRRDLGEEAVEVLNWEYPKCEGGYFNSRLRHALLTPYFKGAKKMSGRHPKLMDNALKLSPLVNSWITMQTARFLPAKNQVRMSWDNGYAPSGEHAEPTMTCFFE